jgi:hypothetical protein
MIKPHFGGRRIVLDTSRFVPDLEAPLPGKRAYGVGRTSNDMTDMARAFGGAIAAKADVPHCPVRSKECGPFDTIVIQATEPTFAGDSAFMLYREVLAFAGTSPRSRTEEFMLEFRKKNGGGWKPATWWSVERGAVIRPTTVTFANDN